MRKIRIEDLERKTLKELVYEKSMQLFLEATKKISTKKSEDDMKVYVDHLLRLAKDRLLIESKWDPNNFMILAKYTDRTVFAKEMDRKGVRGWKNRYYDLIKDYDKCINEFISSKTECYTNEECRRFWESVVSCEEYVRAFYDLCIEGKKSIDAMVNLLHIKELGMMFSYKAWGKAAKTNHAIAKWCLYDYACAIPGDDYMENDDNLINSPVVNQEFAIMYIQGMDALKNMLTEECNEKEEHELFSNSFDMWISYVSSVTKCLKRIEAFEKADVKEKFLYKHRLMISNGVVIPM